MRKKTDTDVPVYVRMVQTKEGRERESAESPSLETGLTWRPVITDQHPLRATVHYRYTSLPLQFVTATNQYRYSLLVLHITTNTIHY